ncbi:MAG: ABC transporter ATP-binding protein [Firmicutes bacterium]|nr:ABC transporter ATP-binding protein [Bacillota bacterium]
MRAGGKPLTTAEARGAAAGVAVAARGVSKAYHRGGETIWALRRLDLDVPEGAFLAVTGPSGCGKTTLLSVLGTLERPTFGDVFIDGQRVTGLSEDRLAEVRRKKIGFVFQTFYLIDYLTALENVAVALRFQGLSKRAQRERAQELLELVGLGDRIHHLPRELSGGQQQRVAIARALAAEPKVILADEPTGNLDQSSTAQILKVFEKIHAAGQTLVVVTHDARVADAAEHRLRLLDGAVVDSTLE